MSAADGIYAKIIADSIWGDDGLGVRLTTMEVRLHRFVLSELNTHRAFSRNSASSRAIPLAKQVERVRSDAALPVVWAAEQKGMQGGDEVEDVQAARLAWTSGAGYATATAERLGELGVHKSIANRLLEPFMWHTVVITSTAWTNFFNLRCSPMAQPEIRVAAEAMWAAYQESEPESIDHGDWHLPYVFLTDDDCSLPTADLPKISAARCARVSYLTQDGIRDPQADLDLYERLTTNGHSSPLEHVATPSPYNMRNVNIGTSQEPFYAQLPNYGNLLGWRQLRFDVEAANKYEAYS